MHILNIILNLAGGYSNAKALVIYNARVQHQRFKTGSASMISLVQRALSGFLFLCSMFLVCVSGYQLINSNNA